VGEGGRGEATPTHLIVSNPLLLWMALHPGETSHEERAHSREREECITDELLRDGVREGAAGERARTHGGASVLLWPFRSPHLQEAAREDDEDDHDEHGGAGTPRRGTLQ
jgi:hypothetical protein